VSGELCGAPLATGQRCRRPAGRCLLHAAARRPAQKPAIDPLSVSCPTRSCQAPPGEPCRSRGGFVEDRPHSTRLLAARPPEERVARNSPQR